MTYSKRQIEIINAATDIDPDQLATVFMGSMRFTILHWRLNQYSSDLKLEGELLRATIRKLISA